MNDQLRQLLDEIYNRDGLDGLRLYANRDLQSATYVDEFIKSLPNKALLDNRPWLNELTARCRQCKQFWFPADALFKCPDCNEPNDQQHTDYFNGQVEDFTYVDSLQKVTKSNEPAIPQKDYTIKRIYTSLLDKLRIFR